MRSGVFQGYSSSVILKRCLVAGAVMLAATPNAQAQDTSSVRIPLKKEKRPAANIVTIHDTVTMFRVDTVRIVETIIRTDTLFVRDTLRDSCSTTAFPIPIPFPLPRHRGGEQQLPAPTLSVTPEPQTVLYVATGLAGLIGLSYFRRRK